MHDGKYKIAQYGQWDGYPEGQGTTALAFCRTRLSTPLGREAFARQLAKCRFASADEVNEAYRAAGADGSGFVSMDVVRRFEQTFPLINRDHGAQILELVHSGDGPFVLQDSIDFAGGSLFCEWAYVIDLDKGTFEVFRGFNREALASSERFANAPRDLDKEGNPRNAYHPVRFLKAFSLDDLPSDEMLVDVCIKLCREREGDEGDE